MPATFSIQPKKKVKAILVSRDDFLKAKPMRHPSSTWKKDKKGLHVRVPRKRASLIRLLPLNREKRVLLDEQGALVWSLCNGKHQIKEIAKKLSEKYNMRVSDAEAALDLYFVQLSKSGLVGFVLPDSAKKRYHRKFDSAEKTETKT